MNDFERMIGQLTLAHAKVKAIDRTVLKEERRRQRSEQLSALRRAIDQLVVVEFDQLAAGARQSALDLETAAANLSASLAGIQTAIGVLDAIGSALGTITSLVKLVRSV